MDLKFNKKKRLGDILIDAKVINQMQLEEALTHQRLKGGKLGGAFIELGILSEEQLNSALSKQLNIKQISIKDKVISNDVISLISEEIIRKHKAIPFYMDDSEVHLAVSNPLDIELEDKVFDITGGKLVVSFLATEKEIDEVIQKHFEQHIDFEDSDEIEQELYGRTKIDASVQSANPIINLTNQMLRDATIQNASDIHIDPEEDKAVIRFRVDGTIRFYREVSKNVHNKLIIKVKNSAGLDFTKTNNPQSGRTTFLIGGNEIDLRIETLPSTNGEKVTIRLLDRNSLILDLDKVGFMGESLERFKNLLKRKSGIVVVTGETGSGKSSLCYAMLSNLNNGEVNILTAEDPVEYELAGVTQVQINERAGLTFPSILRSFLRSDPNIIYVGEMRDSETAEIAVRSAITGHLVLSTLHTNSSAGTISRLVDMGIEPHLVAESLVGVINQRLVQSICPHCKKPYNWKVEDSIKRKFNIKHESMILYKGEGCNECNGTGKKGRIPIQEIMVMNEEISQLIKNNPTRYEIEDLARKDGFITFKEDGWNKTLHGLISLETLKGEILFA